MKKAFIPYKNTIAVLLGIALFVSCSAERKLASDFVKEDKNLSAMVMFPDYLFKTNQKTFLLDSLGVKDESKFDAVLLEHSLFLKKISDTLFMANFKYGFIKELSAFGFNVYQQNAMAGFMDVDSNAFMINVAQLEVEETIYTHRDEAIIYDNYYFHDQDLNAIYINSWIEINEVDKTTDESNVYFATGMISDELEGDFNFNLFTGTIEYSYRIDSIMTLDLYEDAYQMGRTYAGYTFDMILNTYLDINLPSSERSDVYWRYDPYMKTFFEAVDDRLIPLDE